MLQSVYLHLLSSFNVILIGLAINGSTFCEHVHCENNNPCQTVFTRTKGDNRVSAQCLCNGKWAGPRCESQIHVTSGHMESTSVEVEINIKNPTNDSEIQPDVKNFIYTLIYWNNSTDHACALIQELTSPSHRLDGLEPNTDYTICIESGVVETCLLTSHNESALSSNCLFLTTGDEDPIPHSSSLNAILACVLIVILIIGIIIAAVMIRKRHFVLIDNVFGFCSCSNCCCCRTRRPNAPLPATDLIVSPDSPLMGNTSKLEFSPSSPGKLKHRLLKQRSRGFASYSTKHDKKIVLTTVLEYNQDGEMLESDPLAHHPQPSEYL